MSLPINLTSGQVLMIVAAMILAICSLGSIGGQSLQAQDVTQFQLGNVKASGSTDSQVLYSDVFSESVLDDEVDEKKRPTCRSFLFLWPNQDCEDLRLDLCEPLVTDRPDFTEASSTVGRRVTQIELGYTYFTDESGGVRTDSHSYPEVLIRKGLFHDWFELRIGYNAGTVDSGASRISGSEDLYVGAKIGLTPQDGKLPEMAIIPQATLSTGSNGLTAGEDLFGVNWVYSWELSDQFSIAGSTQFNRAVDETSSAKYTQWAQSIALGKSLSDDLSVYTEWYAFFPDNADTDSVEHYINGGFAKLINNNVQWDIRAGVGLNGSADDFFVGTGLSLRFR